MAPNEAIWIYSVCLEGMSSFKLWLQNEEKIRFFSCFGWNNKTYNSSEARTKEEISE